MRSLFRPSVRPLVRKTRPKIHKNWNLKGQGEFEDWQWRSQGHGGRSEVMISLNLIRIIWGLKTIVFSYCYLTEYLILTCETQVTVWIKSTVTKVWNPSIWTEFHLWRIQFNIDFSVCMPHYFHPFVTCVLLVYYPSDYATQNIYFIT